MFKRQEWLDSKGMQRTPQMLRTIQWFSTELTAFTFAPRDGMTNELFSLWRQFYGDLVVLADGANSNFRSQFTPFRPKSQSRFLSLELDGLQLPVPHYAYAFLGSGPPVLVYQIESRKFRILIDILNDTYSTLRSQQAVRSYVAENVLPVVPSFLRPSLREAVESRRLRSMPNSWMPSTRDRTAGLLMLGDAANMRHPMTGAGMTVAIKDSILVSSLLDPNVIPSLGDSDNVLRKLGEFHWKRKYHSASLNILAHALYLLFASEGTIYTHGHEL